MSPSRLLFESGINRIKRYLSSEILVPSGSSSDRSLRHEYRLWQLGCMNGNRSDIYFEDCRSAERRVCTCIFVVILSVGMFTFA